MPLIEGYMEMIMLRAAPVPPATSTSPETPSNPLYVSRIFFHGYFGEISHCLVKKFVQCWISFEVLEDGYPMELFKWIAFFKNCILKMKPITK
jgi:hypothetical protein